ncbi:MAG: DUF4346 domain-containing protein [Nanoarchaeota archaeon]|nr:DUF4346 domain-containing protein [Nanoarchaeota archaeon]
MKDPKSPQWPIYYKDQVYVKDPFHHVGILTLWSKKDIYIQKFESSSYNTIGQLYSREEGISSFVRNLLANKYIRDVVLVGVDMNNCVPAIKAFFESGVDEKGTILNCQFESAIDSNISKASVDELRKHVTLHDLHSVRDYEQLCEYVEHIEKRDSWGEFELFPEPEAPKIETFPSLKSGFFVEAPTVAQAWHKILKTIMKFGTVKPSHYSEDQRELIAFTSVIRCEDPENPKLDEHFPFTKEELEFYIPQVTTAQGFDGLSYTYGSRMMNHDGINQVEQMIQELKRDSFSRRALAFTWNVKLDYQSKNPPCLDLIQALIQDNKLYLTAYIRSNEMYEAWPRNALALRRLQKQICDGVGCSLGNLIIVSNSAHIYERNFSKVNLLIEKTNKWTSWDSDPNGSVLITVNGDMIVMQHQSSSGKKLAQYEARTALEAYKILSRELTVSKVEHAFDVGCELQKAEIAIRTGQEYRQDQVLKF